MTTLTITPEIHNELNKPCPKCKGKKYTWGYGTHEDDDEYSKTIKVKFDCTICQGTGVC